MRPEVQYQKAVKPDECALITELFARRLAHPFALLAYRLGMSPNAVTVLAGLCWVFSTPLAVVAGWLSGHGRPTAGLVVWFGCGFLWNAGYILDLADGSLARMTGRSSRRGFYLDYVFHLLFKPAFLLSIGIGLHQAHGGGLLWLLLAVFSIPGNWSASSSAVEHVLCEEYGKGKLPAQGLDDSASRALWLGVTDMKVAATQKASTSGGWIKAVVVEIFSYYGQFTFFSLTVLADILLSRSVNGAMPITSSCFILVTVVMVMRTPFRVWRDYRRIAASDL